MATTVCQRALPVLHRRSSSGVADFFRTNSGGLNCAGVDKQLNSGVAEFYRTVSGTSDNGGSRSAVESPALRRQGSNLSIRTQDLQDFLLSAENSPAMLIGGSAQPSPLGEEMVSETAMPILSQVPSMRIGSTQPSQLGEEMALPLLSRVPSIRIPSLNDSVAQCVDSNCGEEPSVTAERTAMAMDEVKHRGKYVYDLSALLVEPQGATLEATLGETATSRIQRDFENESSLGPYGPYNPPPSYMIASQRAQRLDALAPYHIAEDVSPPPPSPPDEFEGRVVLMVRGKYKGKKAFVQRKVNKKYRVQVEGVLWGLEFYPNMFQLA